MNMKNIMRMGIVLAILVLIVLILTRVQHTSREKPLSHIDTNDWSTVQIDTQNSSITLQRSNGIWHVQQGSFTYRAEHDLVSTVLANASTLEIGDMISKNPQRHSVFEVTQASGTRARLYADSSDTPAGDFYLGKAAPDYVAYYLRFHGEDAVYFSFNFTPYSLRRDFKQWRTKDLIDAQPTMIQKIVFTHDQDSTTIARTETGWEYNGEERPSDVVQPVIEKIADLRATNVVSIDQEEAVSASLSEPVAQLDVMHADQTDLISFFPIKDKDAIQQYYVRRNDIPGIFIVSSYTFDTLRTDIAGINEPSPSP
ncbi:MAG: DUF4340 domain-containing protein [Elusimicrobia bacterium]|nr:DUF4340 domain-containing protein [Elusimicrobiota bacterium]MBD3412038.1 DUF4340 domain-containing protein [Elusimicrobiota bacterium]